MLSLGLIVETRPLASGRPQSNAKSRPTTGYVETRLWEDPIAAVELATSESAKVKEPLPEKSLVLAVCLSGKPYSEDRENHLRTRMAIVSALTSAGLTPKDGEHLRFSKADAQQRVPYEEFVRGDNNGRTLKSDFDHVVVTYINEDQIASAQDGSANPTPLGTIANSVKSLFENKGALSSGDCRTDQFRQFDCYDQRAANC